MPNNESIKLFCIKHGCKQFIAKYDFDRKMYKVLNKKNHRYTYLYFALPTEFECILNHEKFYCSVEDAKNRQEIVCDSTKKQIAEYIHDAGWFGTVIKVRADRAKEIWCRNANVSCSLCGDEYNLEKLRLDGKGTYACSITNDGRFSLGSCEEMYKYR